MDKIIMIQEKVEDLYGLYMDLRKSEFAVKNVGADQKGTYVYIDEAEAKDPVPMLRSWIGKPAPEPSLSLKKKREKEYEGILAKEREIAEKKKAEEARVLEAALISGVAASSNTPEMGNSPVAFQDGEGNVIGELLGGDIKKESVFKRLWKKLF